MSTPFPIVSVRKEQQIGTETMGTKEKFWFKDAQDQRWLFKFARPGTGEHWAEKVAAEVCGLLRIPCPAVELGTCEGRPGCSVRSFLPNASAALVHGNELLQRIDKQYPVHQLRRVSKHTLEAVFSALKDVDPPVTPRDGLNTAVDWFVGYLLLDAVVSNGDRHHENWGVVYAPDPRLAPSYDHASSLGRELRDDNRTARLHGTDPRQTVEAYLRRARSAFYADDASNKPLHPIAAFDAACQLQPDAGRVWLARLAAVSDDDVERILRRMPPAAISKPARNFAGHMLRLNRQRLIETSESA